MTISNYQKRLNELKEVMTEVQVAFAEEYLANGFNQTRAYLKVKPEGKKTTGYAEGFRMKRMPNVAEYIKLRQDEHLRHLDITQKDIIERLAEIAFAKPQDGFKSEYNNLTGEVIEDKIYTYTPGQDAQLRALEMLGKNLKMFTDKVETDMKVEGVNFIDDIN